MKSILSKPAEHRSTYELRNLVPLISDIAYFNKLKLKPYELNEVCSGLEYMKKTRDSFVINYGEEGDLFYIILKGKVSVWLPASFDQMRQPIKRFRECLKNSSHFNSTPDAFRITRNTLK